MVGIYVNQFKPLAQSIANKLNNLLSDRGVEAVFVTKQHFEKLDLIVVVGGDGTVLDMVPVAIKNGSPIMAINAGGVGFLSGFEAAELELCVDIIASGRYDVDKRPLLAACVDGCTHLALNEVSIQRSVDGCSTCCTLQLSLNIDDEFVYSFKADGIIVSTPTGSTAYSMSAGGAILSPSIKGIIATPLCAHSLCAKPIVFDDNAIALISFNKGLSGNVYCDGKYVCGIEGSDSVEIYKSNYCIEFVKGNKTFYNTLFNKLSSWSV